MSTRKSEEKAGKKLEKTGKKLEKSGNAQLIDAPAATRSICNVQFITSSIY
jgi:hypothetical protein